MNKSTMIASQKAAHARWLIYLGAPMTEALKGETLNKLRAIERKFDKVSVAACNGELEYDEVTESYPELDKADREAYEAIIKIFGTIPEGFHLNTDPRGYALKINDDVMRAKFEEYRKANLSPYTDFGGYGILAPDFE